jgi:hypothetical protein
VDVPAATVYETHLRVGGRVPQWLLVPVAFVRNLAVGYLGLSGDWVAPATIEVLRRSDGTLVGRIAVGSGYYEQTDALATVRRSLESDSKTGFLAAWHLSDEQEAVDGG